MGRDGTEREGGERENGVFVTEAVLGGMGVLYNVELVNCVLCDDGDELFLFYDLSVK